MTEDKHELVPHETPQEKLARLKREAKAAKLRALAAAVEAGEEIDEGEFELSAPKKKEPPVRRGPADLPSIVGGAAGLLSQMAGMGVQDTTAGDAEGGPGIDFIRPAGGVRDVEFDRHGNVQRVRYKPDDWPPRGESF